MSPDDTSSLPAPQDGIEYRHLPGAPGYAVGSDGSVWSYWRTKNKRWRRLKPKTTTNGYRGVTICVNGVRKCKSVHRLILEGFVGPCPRGMQCLHGPAGQTVDAIANLRWGTPSENATDRRVAGNQPVGSRSHFARLTEADVPVVRAMRVAGLTQLAIARKFGVSREAIARLGRGETWRHVP